LLLDESKENKESQDEKAGTKPAAPPMTKSMKKRLNKKAAASAAAAENIAAALAAANTEGQSIDLSSLNLPVGITITKLNQGNLKFHLKWLHLICCQSVDSYKSSLELENLVS